jgi:hypothetical protein
MNGNGDGTFDAADGGNVFLGISGHDLTMTDLTGAGLPDLLFISEGNNNGLSVETFIGSKPALPALTATTTKLQASAASIVTGQSVTFTATVTPQSGSGIPTGTVTFLDGTTSIGSGTVNGTGIVTLSITSLAAGTHSITAAYGGDSNFSASTSTAVSVQVSAPAPDFSIAATPNSQSVAPGGSTSYTLSITPVNGSTQTVALSCAGAPATVACTPASMSSTLNGTGPSSVVFNVTTTGASAMLNSSPSGGQPGRATSASRQLASAAGHQAFPLTGVLGFSSLLAVIFGLGLPGIKARERKILLGFAAMAVLTIAFGCGGGSSGKSSGGGSSGGGSSGTPAGTYTLTLTGTVGSSSHSTTVSLVVQ